MYHTEMNATLDFGPTLSAEPFQLKHQTSFEDEVEGLYLSDMKTQEQDTTRLSAVGVPMSGQLSNLAFKDETDAEMVSVKPEDVTGQIVMPRQADQEDIFKMLNANFDFNTLLDEDSAEMDCSPVLESGTMIKGEETSLEETQDDIDEIQEFLDQFPQGQFAQEGTAVEEENSLSTLAEELLSMEQQHTLNNMSTEFPTTDVEVGEELLDMLLSSDTGEIEQPPDILHSAMTSSKVLDDSGFVEEEEQQQQPASFNVSNLTQFQGPNGQKVIIVVQPAPVAQAAASPSTSYGDASDVGSFEDSDSEWTPDVATVQRKKPGRKLESRTSLSVVGGGVKRKSYPGVRDPKKRKKISNVLAARRYRDKKKQEETDLQVEEHKLQVKNQALRERLTDIENEFKTMKKLMVELGLLKVVKNT